MIGTVTLGVAYKDHTWQERYFVSDKFYEWCLLDIIENVTVGLLKEDNQVETTWFIRHDIEG
jgi:hypothetical protein